MKEAQNRKNGWKKNKGAFRKIYEGIFLSIVLFVGCFSGLSVSAAEEFDPFNISVYSYYKSSRYVSMRMDAEQISSFISGGYMDYWQRRSSDYVYFIDVYVTGKDQKIPADFINFAKTADTQTSIWVHDEGEVYEWRFDRDYSKIVTEDFSPYVAFSVPTEAASLYPESTSYLQIVSSFTTYQYGYNIKFSVEKAKIDGQIVDMASWFKNFYQIYNRENIYRADTYGYSYSYFNNNAVANEEIGYFFLSRYANQNEIIPVLKDSCWRWESDKINEFGHIEFNHIPYNKGTFLISDHAPLGFDEDKIETFSICINAENDPDAYRLFPEETPEQTKPPVSTIEPMITPEPVPVTSPAGTEKPQQTPAVSQTPSGSERVQSTTGPVIQVQQNVSIGDIINSNQTWNGKITGFKGKYTNKGVRLSWTHDASGQPEKIVIYRKEKGNSYQKLASVPGTKNHYTDKKVNKGKSYRYKVACMGSDGKIISASKAASGLITIPYLLAPKLALSKKRIGNSDYLQVKLEKAKGKYIEIYLSKTGKKYKKVPLKHAGLKNNHNKFLLHYYKNMGKIYCKVRTYKKNKKLKRYSSYSKVKQIVL